MSDNSIEDQTERAVQHFLDQQEEFDQQFRAQHAELVDQTKRMRDGMITNMQSRKGMPTDVEEIVTLLMQNTMLIPATKQFIQTKLAEVQKAVQGVLSG